MLGIIKWDLYGDISHFFASKLAERPLFGESGEKLQEKQAEFSSRIAKVAILPFGGVWYPRCPSKMANPSRKRKADLFSPESVNVRLRAKKAIISGNT